MCFKHLKQNWLLNVTLLCVLHRVSSLIKNEDTNVGLKHYGMELIHLMSFISRVCLHIQGICYSDKGSTVQQNDSNRTEQRRLKNNIQIYKKAMYKIAKTQ